jgi:group I intron endonuclease
MLREGKTPTITLQTEVNNGPAAEMAYIKWLRSKGVELWNLTDGGEGCVGYSHSEETKRHLSKTVGATCRKLGSNKGEKNPFYGKKHSEKTKQKLSASHKGLRPWIAGKHHSEKTKLQMSKSHKGIKFSKERCLAISIAHQGLVPPWCEGKHRH